MQGAWANQLYEELENVNANILVPLGNPALAAIMGEGGIMRRRGYLAESSILNRKFLPTIHPSAALRGNYIYRHFITADFKKAAANCDSPALSFPEVEIEITNDFEYAKQALEFLATKQYLSVDIEVMNFEVSCIGFCYKPNHAIVIPMYGGGDTVKWSFEEELYLWERIAEIMENPEIKKLGQNFIFDMQFLLHRNGIVTRGAIDDLMIMNSLTLSDFPKSLEFLVSVHCNRPYWKDMVKWKGADIVKRDS